MGVPATVEKFKHSIAQRESQFREILPAHISVENFTRCALTAVVENYQLLEADQTSLFSSLMKCAQDGLVPNNKEAALVIYNSKMNGQWIKKAQYLPMVDGVLKRARQSGQVDVIAARVVHENDQFDYWMDENGEHINYRPNFNSERGPLRMVFAFAKLKTGELVVEPMTKEEIEKVRQASKNPDKGPWKDWYERMALKSALHRLAKRLPNSSEMMELLDKGNFMYDFNKQPERDITPASETVNVLNNLLDEKPAETQQAPEITLAEVMAMLEAATIMDEAEAALDVASDLNEKENAIVKKRFDEIIRKMEKGE